MEIFILSFSHLKLIFFFASDWANERKSFYVYINIKNMKFSEKSHNISTIQIHILWKSFSHS